MTDNYHLGDVLDRMIIDDATGGDNKAHHELTPYNLCMLWCEFSYQDQNSVNDAGMYSD
jgi:hypothetical protein